MNMNSYYDWEVGKLTSSMFYHHFYLKSDPHITMDFDLNSPCRDTVEEYNQYNTNMSTVYVNFMCNGNVFRTRKVLVRKEYGYVILPVLSFEKRDEIIIMKNIDGATEELKWNVYFDEEDFYLGKSLTKLLTDSINKKKDMMGKAHEKDEYIDYYRIFERTKYTHLPETTTTIYYLVKFNGGIYSDNGKYIIDESDKWED